MHASITIMADRYTHLFPEQQDDLAARMDLALRAAMEPQAPTALRPTADD